MITGEALMTFKKFAQSKLGHLYSEETIKINGTFKVIPSGEIIKDDIFDAHKLGKLNIKEIYKIYLQWFNYTKNEFEMEREFVSVKLDVNQDGGENGS